MSNDRHHAMNEYFSIIARTFYFELRRLASISRFPANTATASLASVFDLSGTTVAHCYSALLMM